jgi:hypothetical protein
VDADLPEAPAGSNTLRYFSEELAAYALAVVLLWEYSRSHPREEFVFGPHNLAAARAGGLVLSGPDLTGPARVLAEVEGLALHEPGTEEAAAARLSGRGRLGGAGVLRR